MASGWRRPVLGAARAFKLERALRGAQYALSSRTQRRDIRDNQRMRLLFRLALPIDASVVDVGANVGDLLAEVVDAAPLGRHVAYEPLTDLAVALANRFPSVDVRNAAVSDAAGEATFHRVKGAHARSSLATRGLPPDAIEPVTVRVETLDDLPTDFRPALIKIDVEGAEGAVLRGARRVLAEHRPIVVFEHGYEAAAAFHTAPCDIHALLVRHDYRIFDIDANGPLDRHAFEQTVRKGKVWTFVAHV
jgi:FkbM family methyltransferase